MYIHTTNILKVLHIKMVITENKYIFNYLYYKRKIYWTKTCTLPKQHFNNGILVWPSFHIHLKKVNLHKNIF